MDKEHYYFNYIKNNVKDFDKCIELYNNKKIIEIIGVPGSGKTTLYQNMKKQNQIKCKDEPLLRWMDEDLFENESKFYIQLKITLDCLFYDINNKDIFISNYIATLAHTNLKYKQKIITKEDYNFLLKNIFDKININKDNHKCIILDVKDNNIIIDRMMKRDKFYDYNNRTNEYINSLKESYMNIIKEKNIDYVMIDSSLSPDEVYNQVFETYNIMLHE